MHYFGLAPLELDRLSGMVGVAIWETGHDISHRSLIPLTEVSKSKVWVGTCVKSTVQCGNCLVPCCWKLIRLGSLHHCYCAGTPNPCVDS